jgi:hypothetical protein
MRQHSRRTSSVLTRRIERCSRETATCGVWRVACDVRQYGRDRSVGGRTVFPVADRPFDRAVSRVSAARKVVTVCADAPHEARAVVVVVGPVPPLGRRRAVVAAVALVPVAVLVIVPAANRASARTKENNSSQGTQETQQETRRAQRPRWSLGSSSRSERTGTTGGSRR